MSSASLNNPFTYALDDEQLYTISASLLVPEMNRNLLADVPEEDPEPAPSSSTTTTISDNTGPYSNNSASNSLLNFHGTGGSGSTTPVASSMQPSIMSSRPRKAPSIRTLGRTSTEQLASPSSSTSAASLTPIISSSATGSSSSTRRSSSQQQSSSSSSTSGSVKASRHAHSNSASTINQQPLHRYRSTPRLPQDKEAQPAPATGMYWSKAPVWGSLPSRTLRSHTATLVDSIAWVFGGSDDSKDATARDIYCFDTETMQWTHPDTTGESPPPCRAHTATLLDKKIVIYGGGLGGQYYDSVYIFDVVTRRWSRPSIHPGRQPAGRRAHSAVAYKGKVWVFGGGNGLTALNDVWSLDLGPDGYGVVDRETGKRALRWEEVVTSGKKPGPRGYHTATLVGRVMVIVGGSDGKEYFTDIWLLDLETLVWSIVKHQPPAPVYRRLSHSATQVGSYLFIIGGHNGSEYCSETLLLNLVSLQFEPRILYGRPPSVRGNHASVLADSRLFVFGGFNGQHSLDDVHILDLAASAYLPQITSFDIEAL